VRKPSFGAENGSLYFEEQKLQTKNKIYTNIQQYYQFVEDNPMIRQPGLRLSKEICRAYLLSLKHEV